MRTLAVVTAAVLACCAAPPPDPPAFPTTGTPPEINRVNATDLSDDIAVQALAKFGNEQGTVTVAGDNPIIDQELVQALKHDGYRVVPRNGRHTILYAISPIGPALMVTLRIDGQRSAKLYRAGPAGAILPASPMTVIEG
jgi:hypothetical protein